MWDGRGERWLGSSGRLIRLEGEKEGIGLVVLNGLT